MTAPARATLGTYGGPWNDYSAVVDATTDVSAGNSTSGGNAWAIDTESMLRTAVRAWVVFTPAGTGSPTLGTNWTMWPTSGNAAPVVTRTGVGLYAITCPVSVIDEMSASQTLNLLAGDCQCQSQSVLWLAQVSVSGNVVSIAIFNSSGALADPSGPAFFCKAY